MIWGLYLQLRDSYLILNEKVEELEEQLAKKAKIINELKESNDFYANKSNWINKDSRHQDRFIFSDCEPDYDDNDFSGFCGKLAREIKKQVEELENE